MGEALEFGFARETVHEQDIEPGGPSGFQPRCKCGWTWDSAFPLFQDALYVYLRRHSDLIPVREITVQP